MNLLELPILALAFLVAALAPPFGARPARRIGIAFDRLARRPWRAALLLAVLGAGGAAATAGLAGLPAPRIHDEFGYLLAADTFAHGRLTNPTPAGAEHFETFHVLLRPSYQSKYPPAQGLLLALGVLLGHPAIGLWLASGLVGPVMLWALRGWTRPRWALLGAALAVSRIAIVGDWAQSYWGGTVAALAGALVCGSIPRLRDRGGLVAGLALGGGLAVLAAGRPFEGAVLGLVAFLMMAAPGWRRRRLADAPARRALAAAAIALLLGLAALSFHASRVTGSALRLPRVEYEAQYGVTPDFLWQSPTERSDFLVPEFRDFHAGWCRDEYEKRRSASGFLREAGRDLERHGAFYLGFVWILPFALGVCGTLRDGKGRRLLALLAVPLGAGFLVSWSYPHYLAPATLPIVALVTLGFRTLARGGPRARALGRALLLATLVVLLARVASRIRRPDAWPEERARIVRELTEQGDRHLILVHYGEGHSVHDEWVYNGADLAAAPVLWARSLDPERDLALLALYPGRHVWRLEIGRNVGPFTLRPGP
ncbi:MAG: hypothetical protein R3F20_02820 [Planctomycetota bacterium]